MRSANRAGGHAPAIAKARVAVIKKAGNAKALLDAVPAEARRDSATSSAAPNGCGAPTRPARRPSLCCRSPRDSGRRSTPTSGGSSAG